MSTTHAPLRGTGGGRLFCSLRSQKGWGATPCGRSNHIEEVKSQMQKQKSPRQQPDGERTGPYITIRYTAAEVERLAVEARSAGITVAELNRRMIGRTPIQKIASAPAKVTATKAARFMEVREEARAAGITVGELIRRMVHEHLMQKKVKASARAKGRASNA